MGKKKSVNEGIAIGLKVSEKIINQELEAMNYLRSKIDLIKDGQDEMRAAVDSLIHAVNEMEILRLFSIANPILPNTLPDYEKRILLNVICSLCSEKSESQKQYLNALRHHLNVEGFEPDTNYNFAQIENISDKNSLKTILKAIKIFLFLHDENFDIFDEYENELFSYFELRESTIAEIDAQIAIFYCLFGKDGLIEMYGTVYDLSDFEQEKPKPYLNVEIGKKVSIDYDVAQIYFKNFILNDPSCKYVESDTFILYANNDKIIKLNKQNHTEDVLLSDLDDAQKLLNSGNFTTFGDMGYYNIGHSLYYIDLNTNESDFILQFEELKDDEENTLTIKDLLIYKSKKVIYKNGYSSYMVDLEDNTHDSKKIILEDRETSKYFLVNDYLYYVATHCDFNKIGSIGYIVKKYSILTGQTTNCSEPFGTHKLDDSIKAFYEMASEGIIKGTYYCVFGYQGIGSGELVGYNCYRIKIKNGISIPEPFYIWNSHICQFEHTDEKLIYINQSKNYSLTSHDVLTDKKQIIIKNQGETEKHSFKDTLTFGKEWFMKPYKYMRLGNWVQVYDGSLLNTKILKIQ